MELWVIKVCTTGLFQRVLCSQINRSISLPQMEAGEDRYQDSCMESDRLCSLRLQMSQCMYDCSLVSFSLFVDTYVQDIVYSPLTNAPQFHPHLKRSSITRKSLQYRYVQYLMYVKQQGLAVSGLAEHIQHLT